MAFLSQSSSKTIPEYTGLQVNTAVQVLPIPIIYGSPRCSLNLVYYNGFNTQIQKQSGGGKGMLTGGKGGGEQVDYFATLIMAIGEGPISEIQIIYQDQGAYTVNDYPTNGAYFFPGTAGQVAWDYIESNWPNDVRNYKNTSYYGFSNAQLDSSATVPQINVVPYGIFAGTCPLNYSTISITTGQYDPNGNPISYIGDLTLGFADADPAYCIYDLLTNATYGAGFPAELIDISTLFSSALAYDPNTGDQALSTYCQAVGFGYSAVLNNAESANSVIERWTGNLIVAPVWNGAQLRFIPYWDSYVGINPNFSYGTGINPKYFSPYTIPCTAITLDHILQPEDKDVDPITYSRKDPMLVYNTVRVDYRDRTNFFNDNVVEAKDEVHSALYGTRVDNIGQANEFTLAAYANVTAQIKLRRNISILRNFKFKLGPLWAWLDPMDIVSIPDPSNMANFITVRIISVEDDDKEEIEITAEEFPLGAQSPTLIPTSPTTPPNQGITNVPPPPAYTPVIFEPTTDMLTATGFAVPQIIIGVSGGLADQLSGYWGGCKIFISLDDISYEEIGTISGASPIGQLSSALRGFVGANPDTTNSLIVNLSQSNGVLGSANAIAAGAGKSLCVVIDASGMELISYTTATMIGADTYALTGLYRGMYGTTSRAFGAGSQFLYCGTDANYFETNLPPQYQGNVFWVKLQAFNSYRNSTQDLSTCIAYQYFIHGPTPAGPKTPPTAPMRRYKTQTSQQVNKFRRR